MDHVCDDHFAFRDEVNPTISIVIPTLNENAYLPKLLDSLRKQTYEPLEVIIADAGSIDGTCDVANEYGVKVIPGGMPAVGRNAGAKIARGEYILFLDADVIPSQDFIRQFIMKVEQNEFDVATCFISPVDQNWLDWILCEGTNVYFWLMRSVSPHAPGFCILSKRSTHTMLDGFDETLMISEDTDYARRASQMGKFGIVTSARIPVSMRRIGKEGLFGIGLKYGWCEIHAMFGKPVRKQPFSYEFGKFDDQNGSTHRPLIKLEPFRQSLIKLAGYSIPRH